jgi:hypothetical protein
VSIIVSKNILLFYSMHIIIETDITNCILYDRDASAFCSGSKNVEISGQVSAEELTIAEGE